MHSLRAGTKVQWQDFADLADVPVQDSPNMVLVGILAVFVAPEASKVGPIAGLGILHPKRHLCVVSSSRSCSNPTSLGHFEMN